MLQELGLKLWAKSIDGQLNLKDVPKCSADLSNVVSCRLQLRRRHSPSRVIENPGCGRQVLVDLFK